MADNLDIDALLIGALYGELTPADEARLSAHLESHPADRSALDDLTRARAAVRDSQIFAAQLEPPQAVSARLLQEAARRAPKRVTRRDGSTETEGWFARFVRTFASHPAVAAAAMLVVVIGVAGTIYLRNGDPYVDKVAPAESRQESTADRAGPTEAATARRATDPSNPEGATKVADQPQVAATAPTNEQADKLDAEKAQLGQVGSATAYDVKLEKSLDGHGGAKGRAISAGPTGTVQKDGFVDLGGPTGGSTAGDAFRHAAPAHAASAKPARALEVDHYDPSPKELGDIDRTDDASAAKANGGAPRDGVPQRQQTGNAGGPDTTARFASGATFDEEKPTTPAPIVATPRASVSAVASGAPAAAPPPSATAQHAAISAKAAPPKAAYKTETKTIAKNEPGSGGAPAQAPRADTSKDKKSADDARAPDAKKPAPVDDKLIAWAKSRHAAAQGLAKDGKCQDVGAIIADVAQRAPDYYNQFVATDRSLKQCQAYIAAERERNADKASKSRAKAAAPAASEDMH